MGMHDLELIKDGWVFKATANSDVMVLRKIHLFKEGRFLSFHDFDSDQKNTKNWYFDHKCELAPKSAMDIAEEPQPKLVRPKGTWTIAATFKGKSKQVNLYMFSILWPKSWAAKGYTTFTVGFESMEEAREWHELVSTSIDFLRQRYHAKRDKMLLKTSPSQSYPYSGTGDLSGAATPKAFDRDDQSTGPCGASFPGGQSPLLMPRTSASGPVSGSRYGGDATESLPDIDDYKDSFYDADDGNCCDSANGDQNRPNSSLERRRGHHVSERWVPYKQTNGVAIYHLDDPESCTEMGGEYMVSASIRGSPADVLSVLMHGSSNTTILGPASKVELLECAQDDENATKEIMRLILEAPGWAGRLCAPREMLVERMLKMEEGMYVVLFSSVDQAKFNELTCSIASNYRPGSKAETVKKPETRQRRLRSFYSQTVLGAVQGTYAMAPLEGYSLDTSPETLITCIMKVDLRGACGDHSWFRPFSDIFGWTDAFLDRILMSVILVRDEVEHSRFVLKPHSLAAAADMLPETKITAFASASTSRSPSMERANSAASATDAKKLGKMFSRLSTKPLAGDVRPVPTARGSSAANPIPEDRTSSPLRAEVPDTLLNLIKEESDEGLDLAYIKSLSTLEPKFWEEIHAPGKAAPFRVRGPTYLKDRKKIPAGLTAFTFAAMDVVTMPHAVEHVARYLPSIRLGRIPFAFIINLIIPGTPLLGIVATFITDRHPDILGSPPKYPMDEEHDWEPFDFVLHKFLNGDAATRNMMLKLIPHIADGSWVITQSVGTTPVITGKALKTTYHVTKQYIEIDIDVSANNVAAYVTGLVRGATKSLVIDMGFVLEGTAPWELPECLLGSLRLNYLDLKFAKPLDLSKEIPLRRAAKPAPAKPGHSRASSFAAHQFNPDLLLSPLKSEPPAASPLRKTR